jgi:hypothetical protein
VLLHPAAAAASPLELQLLLPVTWCASTGHTVLLLRCCWRPLLLLPSASTIAAADVRLRAARRQGVVQRVMVMVLWGRVCWGAILLEQDKPAWHCVNSVGRPCFAVSLTASLLIATQPTHTLQAQALNTAFKDHPSQPPRCSLPLCTAQLPCS